MNSYFYHIQINIDFDNSTFYKSLFSFLGWTIIHEESHTLGYKSKTNGDIWFYDDGKKKDTPDYDQIGMNHIALRTESREDVDALVAYLKSNKINTLFDTPRHREEFAPSKDETYYQAMFKSPDNILFEVVYIGKRSS